MDTSNFSEYQSFFSDLTKDAVKKEPHTKSIEEDKPTNQNLQHKLMNQLKLNRNKERYTKKKQKKQTKHKTY